MDFATLDAQQKKALQNGGISSVSDLLLATPNSIAKQCHLSPLEVKGIIASVCKEQYRQVRQLDDVKHEGDEVFTTGDTRLDDVLGGGIRTGMIWEIVGESAAGKTQLALQLSLTVQVPRSQGGISGSTCYLVTSSTLPTSRLVQISESHPLLSPSTCSLSNIHTISTPTIPILLNVLTKTLPDFLKMRPTNTRSLPPVKLVVIDALAELFHLSTKTTTTTLVERAKYITELSTLLHSLASTYQIAILVLNEVSDAISRDPGPDSSRADVQYNDQVRWFSRAHSIPGEDRKEACLGLVWANQVNARIMLSRTGRRRYREEVEILTRKQKKNKTGNEGGNSPPTFLASLGRATPVTEEQAVLIRRLSVIFNSVGRPRSLDYVVTVGGVFTLPDGSGDPHRPIRETSAPGPVAQNAVQAPDIAPLDLGSTENGSEDPEDAWDSYWRDEIPDEVYNNIDLDALVDSNNTTSSQDSIRDKCSSST